MAIYIFVTFFAFFIFSLDTYIGIGDGDFC